MRRADAAEAGRAGRGAQVRACLLLGLLAFLPAGCGAVPQPGPPRAPAVDPLPSWAEGPARQAITDFVARVTKEGGADFVPESQRLAVFDNDGTLWAEQPIYFQFAFALDRVKTLAPKHPEWQTTEPFKSILAGDVKGALAGGEQAIVQILGATHAGMSTEEFRLLVLDWTATAKHPTLGHRYAECVYQPMLELLAFLRANGFRTFIVSGGGIEFMRPWVEAAYGIPPDPVVGSRGKLKYELVEGQPRITKLPDVDFVDDGPGKPVGIQQLIGRRPLMAVGNSDGDREMLEWTAAGPGARFALLVHHTDAAREWAYDKPSSIGQLDKALTQAREQGWTVVDMQRDWKRVFPFETP